MTSFLPYLLTSFLFGEALALLCASLTKPGLPWYKADFVRVRVPILDHCSCPQPAERAILKYSPHLSVGILFKDSIGDSGLTSPSLYSRIIDPNSGRDSLLSVLCRLSPTPHQHQRNQIYPKYIQNYNQIYLQLKLNLASA